MNVETFDPEIFQKVCGELDLDWIMEALEHAVKVFGRGKVTTNIIFGLGESDRSILEGVERLAGMGIVPTLRPLRLKGAATEAAPAATTAPTGGGELDSPNFKPEVAEIYAKIAEAYKAETGVTLKVVTAAAGTYEQTLKSEIAKSDCRSCSRSTVRSVTLAGKITPPISGHRAVQAPF